MANNKNRLIGNVKWQTTKKDKLEMSNGKLANEKQQKKTNGKCQMASGKWQLAKKNTNGKLANGK